MGRWDALTTSGEGSKTKKDSNRLGKKTWREKCSTANFGCATRTEQQVTDKSGVRYRELKRRCQHGRSNGKNETAAFATYLSHMLDSLPAEMVVSETVPHIFLPFLEALLCQIGIFDRASPIANTKFEDCEDSACFCKVMFFFRRMLSHPQYANAVMAPVVREVSFEGKESLVENSIRRRLLRILEQILSCHQSLSKLLVVESCQTLAEALRVANLTDGAMLRRDEAGDKLGSVIKTVLLRVAPCDSILSHEESLKSEQALLFAALHLFKVYVRLYPESSPNFASLLLHDHSNNSPSPLPCGCKAASSFLCLLHNRNTEAIDCVKELIQHLPLDRWLQSAPKNVQGFHSTLNFPHRTASGLDSLLVLVACLLRRVDSSDASLTLGLSTTLLQQVPFEIVPSLMPSAMQLVEQLSTMMEIPSNDRNAEGIETYSTAAASAFVLLSGGHATPEGCTTSMVLPMRLWLTHQNGKSFFRILLHQAGQKTVRSVCPSLILRSIVRSYPALVVDDANLQRGFASCLNCLTSATEPVRIKERLDVLEGFLEGRYRAASNDGLETLGSSSVLEPFMLELTKALHSGASSCRVAACSCFSYLLPQDWNALETASGGSLTHISPILELCSQGSAHTMAQSLKALGSLCTSYYSPLRAKLLAAKAQQQSTGVQRICTVAIQSSTNGSAKVRCMAIFAIGNLCFCLRQHPDLAILIDCRALESLSHRLIDATKDPDDKVTGNAIRSAGHVASLLLERDMLGYNRTNEATWQTSFYRSIIALLANVVRDSIRAACKKDVSTLSWKDRQWRNKHGWGSCHTLTLLIESGIKCQADISSEVYDAACALVECVDCISLLNEKMASSACVAMTALLSMDSSVLGARTDRESLIGRCIGSCIRFLFGNSAVPNRAIRVGSCSSAKEKRLLGEAERLLSVLSENATISDASLALEECFRFLGTKDTMLMWLLDWMRGHSCSKHVYKVFSGALSHLGSGSFSISPEIEILFWNRTTGLIEENEDEL